MDKSHSKGHSKGVLGEFEQKTPWAKICVILIRVISADKNNEAEEMMVFVQEYICMYILLSHPALQLH